MAAIPVITLEQSRRPMPLIGMGTAAWPFSPSDDIRPAILHAIRLGYRHFDAASIYQSEQPLGDAIAEALRQGLVSSRDEVFVTTKLWCADAHRGLVVPALKTSLRNLGMDFVDLYLVHLPGSCKPGTREVVTPEDLMTFDMAAVWEGMEQCQSLGLAKSIGVSNFSCKKLELLLEMAKIPPAVNQVEMSPLWQQRKLREFCAAKGIHVSAYSPLGASGTPWGSDQVMANNILKEIAEAKGKSLAQVCGYLASSILLTTRGLFIRTHLTAQVSSFQVCLRWVYEQGVSVLVKSFNQKRMEENLDILDWELSEEERHRISQLPQHKASTASQFCSSDGQYKSLEELWDGEI